MEGFIGGPLTINTVGASSTVNFGGALYLSPKNVSKTAGGSGGGHTHVVGFSYNVSSSTNSIDLDLVDQPLTLDS